jgi:hypothetical protein
MWEGKEKEEEGRKEDGDVTFQRVKIRNVPRKCPQIP